MREPPPLPRPDLVRQLAGPFGWLDARLLRERWLERLGPDAIAVLVLLSLAADRRGASFYGRSRMAALLGLDRGALDRALARLLELGLLAHRPWRAGQVDGVWQILPLATPTAEPRGGAPIALGDVLGQLRSRIRRGGGKDPCGNSTPPESRGF